MIATVTFTFTAPADRGPFTCSIRRSSSGTDGFPCSVGQTSRTYDYDFCCGEEIYLIATDRHGVRSDQWNDVLLIPEPAPPSYTNFEAWHDGDRVHMRFDVVSAPGDNPQCEIRASKVTSSFLYDSGWLPCEGSAHVTFSGSPGGYLVTIRIESDSHFNPSSETHHVTV